MRTRASSQPRRIYGIADRRIAASSESALGQAPSKRAETLPCAIFELAALCELVAQLVEHRPFKALVLGSSPSELTTHNKKFTLI